MKKNILIILCAFALFSCVNRGIEPRATFEDYRGDFADYECEGCELLEFDRSKFIDEIAKLPNQGVFTELLGGIIKRFNEGTVRFSCPYLTKVKITDVSDIYYLYDTDERLGNVKKWELEMFYKEDDGSGKKIKDVTYYTSFYFISNHRFEDEEYFFRNVALEDLEFKSGEINRPFVVQEILSKKEIAVTPEGIKAYPQIDGTMKIVFANQIFADTVRLQLKLKNGTEIEMRSGVYPDDNSAIFAPFSAEEKELLKQDYISSVIYKKSLIVAGNNSDYFKQLMKLYEKN